MTLLIIVGAIFIGFIILVSAVAIYHAFDEEKAGTGEVKNGDSADYSLNKIKK
jgi:hypothetical protein